MPPETDTFKKSPILVLDTNVCLDLFVFNDPRWAALSSGLAEKKLTAITKKSCRDEWLAVLHYRKLPINDENRPDIIRTFDSVIHNTDPLLLSHIMLPRCSDKDDQQFMELARDGRATHLITKDKALLKCARKCAGLNLFQIISPEAFIATVSF